MIFLQNDEYYMSKAIALAEKGEGWVNPNPMVGCVIVKDGKVISSDYHRKYGENHAERNAILKCSENLKGATMYVNLEPCSHYGKTPPCAKLISESGIKRVVIGCLDPNPAVSGKGIEILENAGIEVVVGVLGEESRKLNRKFFKYITENKPYVLMKYAMSLDGKIATFSGDSKWISCEESRKDSHCDRHRYSAIMVGVNTVISDNPRLNCRSKKNMHQPMRIICDTNLKTPFHSRVVDTAYEQSTIIVTSSNCMKRAERYMEKGVEFIFQDDVERIDMKYLMYQLADRNIDSLLIEGGGTINWSAVESEVVDELKVYISSKIIGGENAKTPVSGYGFKTIFESLILYDTEVRHIGDDTLINAKVGARKCLQE